MRIQRGRCRSLRSVTLFIQPATLCRSQALPRDHGRREVVRRQPRRPRQALIPVLGLGRCPAPPQPICPVRTPPVQAGLAAGGRRCSHWRPPKGHGPSALQLEPVTRTLRPAERPFRHGLPCGRPRALPVPLLLCCHLRPAVATPTDSSAATNAVLDFSTCTGGGGGGGSGGGGGASALASGPSRSCPGSQPGRPGSMRRRLLARASAGSGCHPNPDPGPG